MKGIVGNLFGAFVLTLAGCAFVALGLLDRNMARAERDINAFNYAAAQATFQTVERYFEYASHVPGIGNGPLNDVRVREASLHYWQQDYGPIVPQQADPVTAVAADNVGLQFVTANAMYRAGLARAKDRQTTLQALDAGINGYLVVLKNASRYEEAAYNLEYLVRLRDDVERGRRKPGVPPLVLGPQGAAGFPFREFEDTNSFKILVPLDSDDRDKSGNAGKGAPKPRKG